MSARVVYLPAPAGKPMDEEQLRAALALPVEHPTLRAINQILDEHLVDAVVDAADPQLNPGLGTHAGGRMDALTTLKTRLHELREAQSAPAPKPAPRRRRLLGRPE